MGYSVRCNLAHDVTFCIHFSSLKKYVVEICRNKELDYCSIKVYQMEHLRGRLASVTKFMDIKHFFFSLYHPIYLLLKWYQKSSRIIDTVLWTNSCIFYKYFSMRKLILLNANVFLIYFYFYCALFFFTTSPWIILYNGYDAVDNKIFWFHVIYDYQKCRSVFTFLWARHIFK